MLAAVVAEVVDVLGVSRSFLTGLLAGLGFDWTGCIAGVGFIWAGAEMFTATCPPPVKVFWFEAFKISVLPVTDIVAVPLALATKVTVPNTLGEENPPAAPAVFIREPEELSTESYPGWLRGIHPEAWEKDTTDKRFGGKDKEAFAV